jgi:hypothetical protein
MGSRPHILEACRRDYLEAEHARYTNVMFFYGISVID